jgi:hypothetical protein
VIDLSDIIARIFGKRKSKDESVGQIRSSINKLTFRSRSFERQAMEYYEKAKDSVRHRNKTASKFYLGRWQRCQILMNRYDRMRASLEDSIQAIESASDDVEMYKALNLAAGELSQAQKLVDVEKSVEQIARTESIMREVEQTSEILSSGLGVDEDQPNVDGELEKLEAEVALEESGQLPKVPATDRSSERREVEKELEQLKSELESSESQSKSKKEKEKG